MTCLGALDDDERPGAAQHPAQFTAEVLRRRHAYRQRFQLVATPCMIRQFIGIEGVGYVDTPVRIRRLTPGLPL